MEYTNRYIGGYPIIGIRPIIDARQGMLDVRGSLEEQTMNMARAVKELFEQNVRYSNGQPVQTVLADGTIGRVAEAAACAHKFKKLGVDITLSVTPCWCYGSETMGKFRILVQPLFTVLSGPVQGPFIFVMIIDTLINSPENFHFID